MKRFTVQKNTFLDNYREKAIPPFIVEGTELTKNYILMALNYYHDKHCKPTCRNCVNWCPDSKRRYRCFKGLREGSFKCKRWYESTEDFSINKKCYGSRCLVPQEHRIKKCSDDKYCIVCTMCGHTEDYIISK